MNELINLLIGIFVLLLGFPLGNFLAQVTREELEQGRKWFKMIIFLSLIGGFVGLIIGSDVLMFSLFFIAIVASRSLKNAQGTKKS